MSGRSSQSDRNKRSPFSTPKSICRRHEKRIRRAHQASSRASSRSALPFRQALPSRQFRAAFGPASPDKNSPDLAGNYFHSQSIVLPQIRHRAIFPNIVMNPVVTSLHRTGPELDRKSFCVSLAISRSCLGRSKKEGNQLPDSAGNQYTKKPRDQRTILL